MPAYRKQSGNGQLRTLAGIDFSEYSEQDLESMFEDVLANKIHGLSFSPYVDGQGPGTAIDAAQIQQRLSLIQSHIGWVRSFSCTEGNQAIAEVARSNQLNTMVGVWLDDDLENNELEIANAIEVGRAGNADIIAVGNEVLLREDLSEDQLITYLARVKAALPDVDVGYVDAYYKFVDYPRVTAMCDVILANCYPFWEGCAAEYSLLYMKDMYRRVSQVANGKKVIISETGWPNIGTAFGDAIPSYGNAMRYFLNTYQWAAEEGIDVFYFSAFDENWKVKDEGDVGAYWGLWDKDGAPKYG